MNVSDKDTEPDAIIDGVDGDEVARTMVTVSKKQRSAIKVGTRIESHEKILANLDGMPNQEMSCRQDRKRCSIRNFKITGGSCWLT